jgi:hypothetical protein
VTTATQSTPFASDGTHRAAIIDGVNGFDGYGALAKAGIGREAIIVACKLWA